MSEKILIRGGRVIDPVNGIDEVRDLLIADGRIEACAVGLKEKDARVIEAKGCYVMPGLIDLHVHFRDPGQTDKEDVVSGARAAARGGFTTVVAMPNTRPVIDVPDRIDYIRNKSHTTPIHVLQAGAVTKGQRGEVLADLRGMVEHGAPAISEDGKSVMNAKLMKEAMRIAAELGVPYLDHCEDADLAAGCCVNDDEKAREEGLPGVSNDAEDVIIVRDIMLAEATGVHLHLSHCSTRRSYELVKSAKKRGSDISAEVCPHHFTLTSADRKPGDTNYKMNPPLREEEDRAALIRGLKEDVFDVIATDHAPHTRHDKNTSMREAPFGIVGLETAVPLVISELVRPGVLTPMQMAEKMSANPARILGLSERGSLAVGMEADVTVIDPEVKYQINADRFLSRGHNTPFDGRWVHGAVRCTICAGTIVYQEKQI